MEHDWSEFGTLFQRIVCFLCSQDPDEKISQKEQMLFALIYIRQPMHSIKSAVTAHAHEGK